MANTNSYINLIVVSIIVTTHLQVLVLAGAPMLIPAVAIPRYMSSIAKAEEAAEDAVIYSMRAGLQTYAVEKLMENGRSSWPDNPWDALETKSAGYATADADAANYGEWRFNSRTANITHMRENGDVFHWDYNKGTNSGGRTDAVGSMGVRESGVGD